MTRTLNSLKRKQLLHIGYVPERFASFNLSQQMENNETPCLHAFHVIFYLCLSLLQLCFARFLVSHLNDCKKKKESKPKKPFCCYAALVALTLMAEEALAFSVIYFAICRKKKA